MFNRFYNILVNNLTFKYKDVHAAAAEVIGLLMMQLANVKKVMKSLVHSSFLKKLQICVSTGFQ